MEKEVVIDEPYLFKVTLKCESCEREKTYIHDKDEFRKKKPINKQMAVFFHLCDLCDAPMRKIPGKTYNISCWDSK